MVTSKKLLLAVLRNSVWPPLRYGQNFVSNTAKSIVLVHIKLSDKPILLSCEVARAHAFQYVNWCGLFHCGSFLTVWYCPLGCLPIWIYLILFLFTMLFLKSINSNLKMLNRNYTRLIIGNYLLDVLSVDNL